MVVLAVLAATTVIDVMIGIPGGLVMAGGVGPKILDVPVRADMPTLALSTPLGFPPGLVTRHPGFREILTPYYVRTYVDFEGPWVGIMSQILDFRTR